MSAPSLLPPRTAGDATFCDGWRDHLPSAACISNRSTSSRGYQRAPNSDASEVLTRVGSWPGLLLATLVCHTGDSCLGSAEPSEVVTDHPGCWDQTSSQRNSLQLACCSSTMLSRREDRWLVVPKPCVWSVRSRCTALRLLRWLVVSVMPGTTLASCVL